MPEVNYFWDPISDNIVREFDDAGNVIADYTTEPDHHGRLISEHRDGATYQHHYDAQGNTVALTDDDGNVTDTFAYSASGEVTQRTGTTPTPFQYGGEHGYYRDLETGEYIVRQRPLSAATGLWMSVDPTWIILSASALRSGTPYIYGNNSPVLLTDPSGLAPIRLDPPLANIAIECSRCNGFKIPWIFGAPTPRAPERLIVVQLISVAFHIIYCDPITGCPAGCEITGPHKIARCTIRMYEYLGEIIFQKLLKNIEPAGYGQDTWCYPGEGGHSRVKGEKERPCEFFGSMNIHADIRAFKYDEKLDPTSGNAIDTWKPRGVYSCGKKAGGNSFDLERSEHLDREPTWWNKHSYQAFSHLRLSFDCCATPKTNTLTIRHRPSGEAEQKRVVKDCISRTEEMNC